MSHRVLLMDGIHNFRDYGGYGAADGRRVKRRVLWRSGQHLDATPDDLARVDALDLAHVIDFRGSGERREYPCPRGPAFGASVICYDGETAALAPHVEAGGGTLGVEEAHRRMEAIYLALPDREPVLWVMRRYFDALAGGEGASLVHCLAGKDRTGMAVALLHHVLGVHPDDAMADFLLTNTAGNLDARVEAGGAAIRAKWGNVPDETIRVLMGVDARYLVAMRKAVEERHGSLDAFVRDVLGVDDTKREALRLHLTE